MHLPLQWKDGSTAMPWKRAKKLRFLKSAPVIRVATVDRHGKPHVTPVCHAEVKGKIYWASDPDTEKVANIGRHRSVALVADIYKASWRTMGGVMVQGNAKIIRRGPLFHKVRGLLYRKFRVYKSNAPFEEGESVIIEVTPSRLVSWWYK
jgi:nitroimidazol reductase NimA-like FMN-containing flavoprotein (pyridoxamine 5'-phosphate oxidase superfamily)